MEAESPEALAPQLPTRRSLRLAQQATSSPASQVGNHVVVLGVGEFGSSAPAVAATVPTASTPVSAMPVLELPERIAPVAEMVPAVVVSTQRAPRPKMQRAWIPRTAVIAALAMSTIALPGTGALSAIKEGSVGELLTPETRIVADASAEVVKPLTAGPSTLSIIQAGVVVPAAPQALAQAVSQVERSRAAASRNVSRSALPGCDATKLPTGNNGALPLTVLCELPQGSYWLQPDAAVAFTEMSNAFEDALGHPMVVSSAYRTTGQQATLRSTKPGLAAPVGKSNHGWGYAVDLSSSAYKSRQAWNWLRDNAATYGWVNPEWAKTSKYEPWHWEYTPGIERIGFAY